MAAFNNYDPKRVVVYYQGIRLEGFMDGTFVTAEYDEDNFEGFSGADGDVTRIRNRNEMGTVTITLTQSSPSNDSLAAQHEVDLLSGVGYGALMVKDLNGTEFVTAAQAWIKKAATVSFADGVEGREWAFGCAKIKVSPGGALV